MLCLRRARRSALPQLGPEPLQLLLEPRDPAIGRHELRQAALQPRLQLRDLRLELGLLAPQEPFVPLEVLDLVGLAACRGRLVLELQRVRASLHKLLREALDVGLVLRNSVTKHAAEQTEGSQTRAADSPVS